MTALVLVGVPGAGKTTVGQLLAERLETTFADSDHLIEQEVGKSISDIFLDEGESYFRATEQEVIARAIEQQQGVLALGGGAVKSEQTRKALHGATVIWLQASLGTAVERVGLNRNRPLLLGNVRGQLHTLMNEREPLYREVANVTVTTDDQSPSETVDAIVAQLQNHVSGSDVL